MTERVAVIGAGMAGLAAARMLTDAGLAVTVFDKSRGLGGRIATRRSDTGTFDHGAQYITVRSDGFREAMDMAVAEGAAAEWVPEGKDRADAWYVGTPGMSTVVRPFADGLTVVGQTRVTRIVEVRAGFELQGDAGAIEGVFDRVLVAIPAPQAASLLFPHGSTFRTLVAPVMTPCWAAMLTFDTRIDMPDFLRPLGAIAAAMRTNSKPGRNGSGDRIVIHAGADWSLRRLENSSDSILAEFVTGLDALIGGIATPVHATAHRWRYAFVEKPLGIACLSSRDKRIVACGDWCIAPRVEAAFQSGRAAATAILSAA